MMWDKYILIILKLNKGQLLALFNIKYANFSLHRDKDAFDYVLTDEYDDLIFDIMMPIMEGMEVLKKLR